MFFEINFVHIQIKGDNPVQEFIVSLQDLLKNGQLVDKSFAFCSVKEDGRAKKIRVTSDIPTNMTLLSAYFKISSTKGRNPFEKQKVFKNNKEVKGELRDPTIYFSFAVAADEDPEELIARVSHEWHCRGGNLLKVKELRHLRVKPLYVYSTYSRRLQRRRSSLSSKRFWRRL